MMKKIVMLFAAAIVFGFFCAPVWAQQHHATQVGAVVQASAPMNDFEVSLDASFVGVPVPFDWSIAVNAPMLGLNFWSSKEITVSEIMLGHTQYATRAWGGALFLYNVTIWENGVLIGNGQWNGQCFIVKLIKPLVVLIGTVKKVVVKSNMVPFGAEKGDQVGMFYIGSSGLDSNSNPVRNDGLSQGITYFMK